MDLLLGCSTAIAERETTLLARARWAIAVLGAVDGQLTTLNAVAALQHVLSDVLLCEGDEAKACRTLGATAVELNPPLDLPVARSITTCASVTSPNFWKYDFKASLPTDHGKRATNNRPYHIYDFSNLVQNLAVFVDSLRHSVIGSRKEQAQKLARTPRSPLVTAQDRLSDEN